MLFSFSILYSVPLVYHLIKHLVTVCRSNSCETKAQSVLDSFFLFTLGSIWFQTEQIFQIGSSHSHRFSCVKEAPPICDSNLFAKGNFAKERTVALQMLTHTSSASVQLWSRWLVLGADGCRDGSRDYCLVIKSQGWVNADGCVSVCATDMWPLCTCTGHRHVGSVCVCMAGPGSKACCALAPMGHGNGGWGVGPPTATRW